MKYRNKPVYVDAFKWTGGPEQTEDPEWLVEALKTGKAEIFNEGKPWMTMVTHDADEDENMEADLGDYIGIDERGVIFAVDAESFEENFEAVN